MLALDLTEEKTSAHKLEALACRRCRERKIKCDFQKPCHNCVKLNVPCVPKTEDLRKKRYTIEYVQSLEDQIAKLEGVITRIKAGEGAEVLAQSLETPSPHETPEALAKPQPYPTRTRPGAPLIRRSSAPYEKQKNPSPHEFETSIRSTNVRSVSVYGPTSIYDTEYPTEGSKKRTLSVNDGPTEFELVIRSLSQNSHILTALKLFFVWQYPDHNMFVYREAFLIDLFHPTPSSMYVSEELVYSIAAMGARMGDADLRSRSQGYYATAKHKLLNHSFDSPSIASVQAFLLLAFFDICDGNNALGWMLSGNSFRMGYDLGFQLDPAHWFVNRKEGLVSPINLKIRLRIYWGCYMADHFISLLLGRPSLINIGDATIPESEDLPDVTGMEEFLYLSVHPQHSFISTPLRYMTDLISLSEEILRVVFNKNREGKGTESLLQKVQMLDTYNAAVQKWHAELPTELAWQKSDIQRDGDNPTLMNLRYYYYIIRLCINRPFVAIYPKKKKGDALAPSTIVANVISDLQDAIERFRQSHPLSRASIFIVYSAIILISMILLTGNRRSLKRDPQVLFFLEVLRETLGTWKLAEKSRALITLRLDQPGPKLPNPPSLAPAVASPRFPTPNHEQILHLFHHLPRGEPVGVSEPLAYANQAHPASGDSLETAELYALDDSIFASFGGPPVLMSDMFNEDWESLFPDYLFTSNSTDQL